jgi:hypothetical protein
VAKLASELNNSLIQLESYEKATKHDYKTAWKRMLKFGSRQFKEFTVTYPDYRGKFKQNKQLFLATDPKGLFHAFKDFLYDQECAERMEDEEDVTVNIFKADIKNRFTNMDDLRPEFESKKFRVESNCFICEGSHPWGACQLTLQQKHRAFYEKNLCKNCGKKGHIARHCDSDRRCVNCSENRHLLDWKIKHHDALCPEN